jgi:SRSO17 transposase
MAAGLRVDLDRWRREFDGLMLRVGGRFARVEPRRRMAAFVRGLLAGLPRVNCWSIAEHAGEDNPRGMQRLLSAAVRDEAGVRDDLREYVLEHLADPGAVLVADETGDLKKGTMSVAGTRRQYTGTAGRTEKWCQRDPVDPMRHPGDEKSHPHQVLRTNIHMNTTSLIQ